MDSERRRFETAAVPKTIVRVAPHQQDSARRLVQAGWIAFGEVQIEAVARPLRADRGGMIYGDATREAVPA